MCRCTYLRVQRPEDTTGCPALSLCHSPLYSLERGALSLNLELGWSPASPIGSPLFPFFPQCWAAIPVFLCRYCDPNTGPLTGTVSHLTSPLILPVTSEFSRHGNVTVNPDHTPLIPAFRRWSGGSGVQGQPTQHNEFKSSLGYTVRPCVKKKKKMKKMKRPIKRTVKELLSR